MPLPFSLFWNKLFNNLPQKPARRRFSTTTYTYLSGSHGMGSTTPLVQTMPHQGKTLTYAYDDTENILSVNDGSKTVNYGYDMLGQMIRANAPYNITADGAGKTWAYAYDLGGNILSKTAYAYTTNTVGTAVKTDSFTYGDANKKDKLTAYLIRGTLNSHLDWCRLKLR